MIRSRDGVPYYKFELCFGLRCNYRCRYCFQPLSDEEIARLEVSDEHIDRYADYIKHICDTSDPNNRYTVAAVGGESLLYLDKMLRFARRVRSNIETFCTVTNGSLIRQKLPQLLEFRKLTGMGFEPIVSYDFCFQNETRHPGSYQTVRDNIYLLYARGFPTTSIAVFDKETLPRIDEWFEDFLRLLEKVPTLRVKFNLSRGYHAFEGLDEERARRALEKVQAHLKADPELQDHFYYNAAFGYRGMRLPDAFVGDIMVGMSFGGDIYPGYDVPFCPEPVRDAMRFGHITDDFADLEANRHKLLDTVSKLELPKKCTECNAVCRVLPWSNMKNSVDEYYKMDDDTHCYVHHLVSEYISHRVHVM